MTVSVLLVILAASACGGAPRIAPGMTPTAIRSVKMGMTQQQVIAILGPPLRVRPWGHNSVIFDYAVPGWATSSPGLWVHVENETVSTVQAKQYHLIRDDEAVYELSRGHPVFETPAFEPLFNHGG
jgi:hypothetical protein